MNVATQLDDVRLHAAQLSGGTSSEPIYDEILGAVHDLDLHGSVLDFGADTGRLLND